jgi:AraC-like DNA-binding protein
MPTTDASSTGGPGERIAFRRPAHLRGVELLEARSTDRLYTMFHERYAISLNLGPAGAAQYRRATHEHPHDVLFLAEPGELHRCVRADGPLDFLVIFVDAALVREAAGGEGATSPVHWNRVMSEPGDPRAAAMRALARCAAQDGALAAACVLADTLTGLVRAFAEPHRADARASSARGARPHVLRARELLDDRYAEDVPLDTIAREVGLSREHLVRAFAAEFGTPPHAYVMQVRVTRARAMLAAGASAGSVAVRCGFCDQSHMNRWFRKTVGVTPAAYARRAARR